MGKSTSPYPRLSASATGTGVVSHAGSVLLLRTAEKTGLTDALSVVLSPWRKPLSRHDPGKIVLDLAVALALGGDCLADIAQLRAHPEVFGPVASDPTVSRLIATLAADADMALSAIDAARAAVRTAAWSAAGDRAPDDDIDEYHPLIIDLDATLVTAHSEKEHAAPTFKRGFSIPPVVRVRRPRWRGHRGTGGDAAASRQRRLEHRRRPHHRRQEGVGAVAVRSGISGRPHDRRSAPMVPAAATRSSSI